MVHDWCGKNCSVNLKTNGEQKLLFELVFNLLNDKRPKRGELHTPLKTISNVFFYRARTPKYFPYL